MPKRKRTIIDEVQPETEDPIAPLGEEELRREEEIQNFVQSFGPGVGKISIYRLDKAGRLGYVGSLPPGAVSESLIQDNFGGGEFVVRLLDDGGRFLKQKSLVIEEPKRETTSIGSPGLDASSRIQIELLQQHMARQHEMLLKMIERTGNGGSSATELATALAQLRGFAKPATATEIANAIAGQLREFVRPSDSLESIRSAISLLNEGIKIVGKNPRGASERESNFDWRGVLEALPGVVASVSALRSPPNSPSSTAVRASPTASELPRLEELAVIRDAMAYLKAKALAGKSVDLIVDWVSENFDEPPWLQLTQRLIQKPFEYLGEIDPDIQLEPLRSWFFQLYTGLKQVVEERAAQTSSGLTQEEESSEK